MEERRRLIVGLGNPGTKYEMTRHNLGFIVVEAFAKKHGLQLKKETKFSAAFAQGVIEKDQVLLLLPMTYMNLSGTSVRKVCDYFKIPFEEPLSLLVVVDDVYLKFGSMRIREEGSSGGHNGLKNIEEHLQSKRYARLRMGIGPKSEIELMEGPPLEDYVLASFNAEEREQLPSFVEKGVAALDGWLNGWSAAIEVITRGTNGKK